MYMKAADVAGGRSGAALCHKKTQMAAQRLSVCYTSHNNNRTNEIRDSFRERKASMTEYDIL